MNKNLIGNIIMIVIVGAIAFKLISGQINKQKYENLILTNGGRAIAEILDKKTSEGGRMGAQSSRSTYYVVYYRFEDGKGNAIKGKRSWLEYEDGKILIWDKKNVGDTIEVAYDKEDPEKNLPVIPTINK